MQHDAPSSKPRKVGLEVGQNSRSYEKWFIIQIFTALTRETAGAARSRHSLLPLLGRDNEMETSGQSCRENAKARPLIGRYVYRVGRNSSHIFRVVPAQAGTHTHECQLLRCAGTPIPFIKNIGGYGSWLSPGRRRGEIESVRAWQARGHILTVVPAEAGTHTHECQLLRCAGAPIPFIKNIGGYGSWLSPGRRGETS